MSTKEYGFTLNTSDLSIMFDDKLSLRAKGLYFTLKQLRYEGSKITRQAIIDFTKDSRKSVDSGLRELKEQKVIFIERAKAEDGMDGRGWAWRLPHY